MANAYRPGWLATSTFALFLLAGEGLAQDQLLQETRQRIILETQRVEKDVEQARAAARQLGRSEPATAAEFLRKTLAEVEANTNLPEDRRASLVRSLQTSIKDLDNAAAVQRLYRLDPARPVRPGNEVDRQREQAMVNSIQQQIRTLQSAGQTAEARKLADDLATRLPGNPAAQAARIQAGRVDAVADARTSKAIRNENILSIYRGIDRASTPITGDIEFPPDWKEKSARRKGGVQLTPEERALLTALNKPIIGGDFEGQTFQNVMTWLEKATGQPIVLDKQILQEAGVSYETPVNLKLPTASTRTILRRILAEVGLTYIIKDAAIVVTTPARARETLTTRTYYIGDLVSIVDVRLGPVLSQAAMFENINRLALQIQNTIDPQSWAINNGPGTIAFDPITMTLVIRQTAEVHSLLGVGLR